MPSSFVPAIAVVVDPLARDDVIPLAHGRPFHEPARRIVGIDDHRALARLDLLADLKDKAVAVEVLGRVLVEEAVPVIVIRTDGAAVRLSRVQVEIGPVGVVLDPDIDRLRVDELREGRVLAVAAEDVRGEPKGRLGRRHLARVPVPLDEHGRLVRVLAGLLVGDRDLPDIAPLEALADGIEVDKVRIIGGPLAKESGDFVVGMVVHEIHFPRHLRFREDVVGSGEVADPMADTADDVSLRGLRLRESLAGRPRLLGHQSDESDAHEYRQNDAISRAFFHGTSWSSSKRRIFGTRRQVNLTRPD